MKILFLAVLLMAAATGAFATDHIDGSETKRSAITDLTDLYAFPGPGGRSLVIALNAFPIAPPDAHPEAWVSFAVILRKAAPGQGRVEAGSEMRIDCTFAAENDPSEVTCATSAGLSATTLQDRHGWTGAFPLFFGRRSDPFFFDAGWSEAVSTTGRLPPPGADNTMASLNVLSLVIELDRSHIFGGDFGLLAIAAEALDYRNGHNEPVRRDRLGRPEITNVTLVALADEEDLRDGYNRDAPFSEPAYVGAYRDRIARNIVYYDVLDGQTHWRRVDVDRWAALLVDDFLLVDIAKPCTGDRFLEIERALMSGLPHRSCGGRKLTDDVMDRLYGFYVNGGTAALGDGVDAPDAAPLTQFPYLADPATGLGSWIRAFVGNIKANR